jgi:hypothetical protein
MVEGQSVTTVADVVSQVRDGRFEDFVGEALGFATTVASMAATPTVLR